MYLRYFGFDTYPFAVTPDPAFLYLSASHRAALAHLLYGAGEHGGFVSLVGEVGTGKTTLIRSLVDSDLPDLEIALCWNPQLDVHEFVATICDELGVARDEQGMTNSLKSLTDRLNCHLLATHARNRRTVLVIDEAQNLSRDVLEQLRLLTNLETHKHKLLRIILVGQPELSSLLARQDLRQLDQRITARSVLKPLLTRETRAYVQHRLACANGPQHLFSPAATTMLRWVTGGVPRLINMVCERALMGAYAHGRSSVGMWVVLRAAIESLPRRRSARLAAWWRIGLPTGVLAAVLVAVGLAWLPDIPLTNAAESNQQPAHQKKTIDDSARAHEASDSTDGDTLARNASRASEDGASSSAAADDVSAAEDSGSAPDDAAEPARIQATQGKASKREDARGDADRSSSDDNRRSATPKPAAASASDDEGDRHDGPSHALSRELPDGDADLNQLLRLWGVFGSEVHSRCARLSVGELRCLSDTGDLARLQRYNRPALITVSHDDRQQTVMLTALNKTQATLVGGNGTRDVPRDFLAQHWNGQFEILWRSDAGVRLIRPGSVGNAVVWLRTRLDEIDGKNPDSHPGKPSPVYDEALGKRLEAFQAASGLEADGLAGPRTQMMLNGAVPSPGTPVLRSVSKDKP